MSTITDDKTLRESIERELKWIAQVDAAHIAVSVNDGAIVLAGHVPSFFEKWEAVQATERVYGVRAVVDNIDVKLAAASERDDSGIAEEITRHMHYNTAIPDSVQAEVKHGHVTLHGEVAWPYQQAEAARALRYLLGVKGLTNLITVKPQQPKADDVTKRIGEAIERMAHLDARSVWATTSNGTVRLHGHVHSFSEKHTAGLVAASAPGVIRVENQVSVTP